MTTAPVKSTDMGAIGERGPDGWTRTGEGQWVASDGATISRVNPRGQVFYALRLEGTRRPDLCDSLAEARRKWERHAR